MSIDVEFCVVERSQPFVSGVWGRAPLGTLEQIESAFKEFWENVSNEFHSWVDCVTCRIVWVPDQRDNQGRFELEGYWDFEVICASGFGQQSAKERA